MTNEEHGLNIGIWRVDTDFDESLMAAGKLVPEKYRRPFPGGGPAQNHELATAARV